MDETKQQLIAIMFADVAGSTHLYERLGDVQAESQISGCLSIMIDIVEKNEGLIVKNIGDEILCHFPTANCAVNAACSIQETLAEKDTTLQVRIGINFGPAIFKQGDIFGDTVNVAARMAGLAKAEQIIGTGCFFDALVNPDSIDHRKLDPLNVKGKNLPIDIYEFLWKTDDAELTCFLSAKSFLETKKEWIVHLAYGDSEFIINKERSSITMGRGNKCNAVINSPHASRNHALIISRWGKAVLQDKSTNGTFVTISNDPNHPSDEVFVHMEEFALPENGILSLGIPAKDNPTDLIHFKYQ